MINLSFIGEGELRDQTLNYTDAIQVLYDKLGQSAQ